MSRRHFNVGIAATTASAGLALGATILDAPTPARAALAIAMFASLGSVWAAVILPSRVNWLERAAVAMGLALAAPVLGGLVLQAVGLPLQGVTWAALLAVATLAGDAVLVLKQWMRPTARQRLRTAAWRLPAAHAAAYGAAAAIAVSAIWLAQTGAVRQRTPGFTELWLSPRAVGNSTANLGLRDQEGRKERYRLVLMRDGGVSNVWNITLGSGQTWQRMVTLSRGGNVAANLYLWPDLTHPYRHVEAASEAPQT